MMTKPLILLFLIASLFLDCPIFVHAEDVQTDEHRKFLESLEQTKRDLEKARGHLEQMERNEEKDQGLKAKTDPLYDQIFSLLQKGQYDEAKKTIDELDKINPQEPLIPTLKEFTTKLQQEPDSQKKQELLMSFVATVFAPLHEKLEETVQMTEELNKELKELGPKDADEELCFAAAKGDTKKVQELLERGISANARDHSFRMPALEYAAGSGNVDIVRSLLARGADANAFEILTPLMSAASKGHTDIVVLLLEAGADVSVKTKTGVSALGLAKGNGDTEIVELLRKKGAREQ